MAKEQVEKLGWLDLSAGDVYHIAHIENESRDTTGPELEKLTRRWLDMQVSIHEAQASQEEIEDISTEANRSNEPETTDDTIGSPTAINISQPEDSPTRAYLTVPPSLADRYKSTEERVKKGRQAPSSQFVAAAVLYDEEQEIGDKIITGLARDLAAADKQIRENPRTPILVISRVFLQAGTTAAGSGLYFKNYPSPEMTKAMGLVPCESVLEADVDTNDPASVTLANSDNDQSVMNFLTPRYVLTPDNIDQARDISSHFLEDTILIVGQGVTPVFFNSLISKKRGSKGAEQRRVVAEKAVKFLTSHTGESA